MSRKKTVSMVFDDADIGSGVVCGRSIRLEPTYENDFCLCTQV